VKRTAIGITGLVFGLFLTWLCLYVFSHMHWPQSGRPVNGCHELGKCPVSWLAGTQLFLSLFGPALLFGLLNGAAWKRWTLRKWMIWFAALIFFTVVFYLYGYAHQG
jgi:hypothetical protein